MFTTSPSRIRASSVLLPMFVVCCAVIAPLGVRFSVLPSVLADSPRANEPCVLLSNDNVLFGQGVQIGEFVVVYSPGGGEIRLPRGRVVCWASSIEGLYQYRLDHRLADDFAARLREAYWCVKYDLAEPAAKEIAELKKLDPAHPEISRVQRQLARLRERIEKHSRPLRTTEAAADNVVMIEGTDSQSFVQPTAAIETESTESASITSNPRTLQLFASHVQPMMLNRCGRCHSHESGRRLQLLVPTAGSRASARMTRENLSAVLRFVDRNSPDQSELFVKATSAHGGSPAPLSGRNGTATRFLVQWLETTKSIQSINFNPLADRPPAGQRQASPPIPTPPTVSDASSVPRVAKRPVGHTPPSTGNSAGQSIDEPSRLPQVNNPFDPNLFNRRYHRGERSDSK